MLDCQVHSSAEEEFLAFRIEHVAGVLPSFTSRHCIGRPCIPVCNQLERLNPLLVNWLKYLGGKAKLCMMYLDKQQRWDTYYLFNCKMRLYVIGGQDCFWKCHVLADTSSGEFTLCLTLPD